MSKKSRNTRVIVWFIVLMSVAWTFYKAGSPFAKTDLRGAQNSNKIQDELLKWDTAKRSNYNAKFEIIMEVNNFNSISDSLGFVTDTAEENRGTILSKYEFLVRVPVQESKSFNKRIKKLGNLVKFSSDYSTALGAGSMEAYNDSLLTLNSQRKKIEKLRRDNPMIKGYNSDIAEVDLKIDRIHNLKFSLQNMKYDLYMLAFSEKYSKTVGVSYTKNLAKNFVISLAVLSILVPILFLGFKLLFKLIGFINVSSTGNYGGYYSKGYKSGSYGSGYGSYGKQRKVKRIYKDNDGGSKESK